jgi:hypothetical protein
MKELFRELGAFVFGATTAFLLFVACLTVGVEIRRFDFEAGMLLLAGTTVALIVFGFAITWRLARRKLGLSPFLLTSPVWITLMVLFGVTWACGVPMVHSDLTSTEIAQYKKLKAEDNRSWDAHPYIKFFVSIPVAPGVIMTYHEYQLAGLYGEGTWDFHAWYGTGTYRLFGVGTWIS